MGTAPRRGNDSPLPRCIRRVLDTPLDDTTLPLRSKEIQDSATPSGNALAIQVLLALSLLEQRDSWYGLAQNVLSWISTACKRYPLGFAAFLRSIDIAQGPAQQIAFLWHDFQKAKPYLQYLHRHYRPRTIWAGSAIPPSQMHPI
jgi:uncharacterized protein YyaL (SSP411 family)